MRKYELGKRNGKPKLKTLSEGPSPAAVPRRDGLKRRLS